MTTWREVFREFLGVTDAQLTASLLRATQRQRRRIANNLAIHMQEIGERIHADTILAEMPAADDMRDVHELLAAVHAKPDAATVPPVPAPETGVTKPLGEKAMRQLQEAIQDKMGRRLDDDWAPLIWYWATTNMERGQQRGGRSKWRFAGMTRQNGLMRWQRFCDLGYHEKVMLALRDMPVTREEYDALETLCTVARDNADRRARRGVGDRKAA